MAFIKLHSSTAEEILVNTFNISYVEKYEYEDRIYPKCHSIIFLNSYTDDEEDTGCLYVYETLDEIAYLANK
ncbi:MAG: hypothetical protein K2K89_03960 [Ruminococcus sp.]|nr:hypothetical protein [Ruminococcus sp.]